jgi:mRNA interferase MazF
MVASSSPEFGDIIWVNFSPSAGHEQAGHRPALVLSQQPYNQKIGMCLACPITSKIKGYPFEAKLNTKSFKGVALSDQVRSIDWQSRMSKNSGESSIAAAKSCIAKINLIFGTK